MKKISKLLLMIMGAFAVCGAGEMQAANGYFAFSPAVISEVATEFTGYTAVRMSNPTNSSEYYWFFIDPTLGADGAKALLSTVLTAKSTGVPVNAVYWKETTINHTFYWLTPIISERRLHTLFMN